MQPLPNESDEYTKRRVELLDAEIELKEARERVAALRRALPTDNPSEDHRFVEIPGPLEAPGGEPREVRLSALFVDPTKPLVLMHFMYGKAQKTPCPMCTMWADGYDGVMAHLERRVNFAVLIAGDIGVFRRYAQGRGWRNTRFVSAADSTLKAELGLETPEGQQLPGVSVFTCGSDGVPRHFYSACAMMGGDHFRGLDLLSPVWNFFDLTPVGRGDFMPTLGG